MQTSSRSCCTTTMSNLARSALVRDGTGKSRTNLEAPLSCSETSCWEDNVKCCTWYIWVAWQARGSHLEHIWRFQKGMHTTKNRNQKIQRSDENWTLNAICEKKNIACIKCATCRNDWLLVSVVMQNIHVWWKPDPALTDSPYSTESLWQAATVGVFQWQGLKVSQDQRKQWMQPKTESYWGKPASECQGP